MTLILGPDIAPPVQKVFRDLEREYVSRFPKAPVRLPDYLQANLPSAADCPYGLVIVSDLGVLAFSNGSAWRKADGSAI